MLPLEERLAYPKFSVFVSYETLEFAWRRIEPLLGCGRPMIFVENWCDGGNPTLSPGLALETRGFREGANFVKDETRAEIGVTLSPGIHIFNVHADVREGTERDAATRFHARKDGARLEVMGFGNGRDDHIRITEWNSHCVGCQKAIYFQYDGEEENS